MPSAQVSRTALSLFLGSGDITTYNNDISTLKNNIGAGKTIYFSDISLLGSCINKMLGHYHNYTDAYQLATYGAGYGDRPSAGDRNNYYTNGGQNTGLAYGVVTGSQITGGISGSGDFKQAGTIRASDYNTMNTAIKTLRSHRHSIVDRTSA